MIEIIITDATQKMWDLVEQYLALGRNERIPAIRKFLNEMLKERERLPESESNVWFDDIIRLAQLDMSLKRGLKIKEHCKFTEPILARLTNEKDWKLIDIRILVCAILVTDDIERGLQLLNKALKVLKDKYSDREDYRKAVLFLKYNFTHSLLKVHYLGLHKKSSPIDIQKLFDELSDEVLALSDNEEFYTVNASMRARHALFNDKAGTAEKIVDELKNRDYKDSADILECEIAHYNYLVYNKPGDVVNKMWISQTIRHIRESQDLTQEEFAEIADISNTAVSEAENQRTLMSITTLAKIAKAFNLTIESFLSEELTPVKKNERNVAVRKINAAVDSVDVKNAQLISDVVEAISGFVNK